MHSYSQPGNILNPQRIDSLPSVATGFGETADKYFFSVSYSLINQTGFPFHSARLVSIDKQTLTAVTLDFPKTADTFYTINNLAVINDTVHCIVFSLWHEQPADIYHYAAYAHKYDAQLQQISSKWLFDVEDTFKNYGTAMIEFNEQVYVLLEEYSKPPQWGRLMYYSVYNRVTDTPIVVRKRLNPDPWASPTWMEKIADISTDDSGNIIVSTHAFGTQTPGTYYTNFLAVLNVHDNYDSPERRRYFFWDSTATYELGMKDLPEVRKKGSSYYFVSKSMANYFSNPSQNNHKIGVYKGRFRDTCIVMDTSYNTLRNGSYTSIDIVARTAGDAVQFLDDSTLIFVYAGNDENNFAAFNPCQNLQSALEIVILDTNLAEKKKHTLVNPYYNAGPFGFRVTSDGDLVVWGHLCPQGAPFDSINLFAFLIDPHSGFPVNIYNAESFVNASKFELYPNPVDRQITVKGRVEQEMRLDLYDLTGRRVLTRPIYESEQQIDLGELVSGIYVYHISRAGEAVQTGKIVKQ